MQLVDKPQALPGQCKGCGAADKFGYIDTGWQEEFYGAIYFCRDCVLDMASYYGAVAPEQYTRSKRELMEAQQKIVWLEMQYRANIKILEGIDGLVDLRTSGGIDSLSDSSVVVDSTAEESEGERIDVAEGTRGLIKPSDDKDLGVVRASKSARAITV